MFFGLFKEKKKEPPILKSEMLQPVDTPISTAEAKKIFKTYMVQIGFLSDKDKLDRVELQQHVEYLADEIREHEELLKADRDDARRDRADEIKSLKADIQEYKKALAKCTDPAERKELEDNIEGCEGDIAVYQAEGSGDSEALDRFKADKREFLINYINLQVHGPDWRSKL